MSENGGIETASRRTSGGPQQPTDGVSSFVLRIDKYVPASGAKPRLCFTLEDVSTGRSWRLTDFRRVVDRLSKQISAIENASPS
jgi:hypothetical protein